MKGNTRGKSFNRIYLSLHMHRPTYIPASVHSYGERDERSRMRRPNPSDSIEKSIDISFIMNIESGAGRVDRQRFGNTQNFDTTLWTISSNAPCIMCGSGHLRCLWLCKGEDCSLGRIFVARGGKPRIRPGCTF